VGTPSECAGESVGGLACSRVSLDGDESPRQRFALPAAKSPERMERADLASGPAKRVENVRREGAREVVPVSGADERSEGSRSGRHPIVRNGEDEDVGGDPGGRLVPTQDAVATPAGGPPAPGESAPGASGSDDGQ